MAHMSKLRKSAKGRECQVRMGGICNGNPETVVLCHLNGGGMGTKHPDLFAAFACSSCHDEADGRTMICDRDWVKKCFYEGIFRTQAIWIKEGLISVK